MICAHQESTVIRGQAHDTDYRKVLCRCALMGLWGSSFSSFQAMTFAPTCIPAMMRNLLLLHQRSS